MNINEHDEMTEISKSIIEKFLLPNPQWQDGFKSFSDYLGHPAAWLVVLGQGVDPGRLVRAARRFPDVPSRPHRWDGHRRRDLPSRARQDAHGLLSDDRRTALGRHALEWFDSGTGSQPGRDNNWVSVEGGFVGRIAGRWG